MNRMGIVMKQFCRGFSLVEIMVGLGLGMISMIVIMQVFAVFEGGKRTVTGGADAQGNGAVALYMIERDTRMAGWGMDASMYAGCNTTYTYCDGKAACGGAEGPLGDMSFAPVRIRDGGGNPDTVSTQFYSNPSLSSFRLPANTTLRGTMPQPSSELNVHSTSGCREDDMVLVQQDGNCTLMQITEVQGTALKIQHNPGASGPFNPPANYQNENGWPAYREGARLSCFKHPDTSAFYKRIYSIDTMTRQLQVTDDALTNGQVAPDIVDLQAQYGIAPAGSQEISEWVDAVGPTWADPSEADATRIKAVRIALVARSPQYERPDSGTCRSTTAETVKTWPNWAAFDTSRYPAGWQCYRYKVLETVVPLRNAIWGNA